MQAQATLEPVYETFKGWREGTRGARSWAQLPAVSTAAHTEPLRVGHREPVKDPQPGPLHWRYGL